MLLAEGEKWRVWLGAHPCSRRGVLVFSEVSSTCCARVKASQVTRRPVCGHHSEPAAPWYFVVGLTQKFVVASWRLFLFLCLKC